MHPPMNIHVHTHTHTHTLLYLGVVPHEMGQGTSVSEQSVECEGGESTLVEGEQHESGER